MPISASIKRHKVFIVDIAAMMSGKTVAAVIALGTMPIVTRLFSPADFGVAASFMSIVGIVSQIATMRFERAIVLPKDDQEAILVMSLTYRILLFVCVLMLIVIALQFVMPVHVAAFELLGGWQWLLPVGVALMAGLTVQEAWIARKGGFKLVAASTVLGTVVNSAVRIGGGIISGTSVAALILSNLVGMFSRTILQRAASVEGLKSTFQYVSFRSMRATAVSYSDFPKFDAPAGLVFALGQNLPVLLFGTMFSPAAAGLYAMANRLSQAPLTIVSTSVRRVFLQKIARISNRGGSLQKAFLMTTGGLAAVGMIPFVVIWLFGQPLLTWLLGEDWTDAGRYLEIMAPWLLMMWVTATANPVFVVCRKQQLWLTMQTILTLLRLCAFGLAYLMSAGPEWTLGAFVYATVAGNIATIVMAWNLIKAHGRQPPGDMGEMEEPFEAA